MFASAYRSSPSTTPTISLGFGEEIAAPGSAPLRAEAIEPKYGATLCAFVI